MILPYSGIYAIVWNDWAYFISGSILSIERSWAIYLRAVQLMPIALAHFSYHHDFKQ
jgi:hypothetical protein